MPQQNELVERAQSRGGFAHFELPQSGLQRGTITTVAGWMMDVGIKLTIEANGRRIEPVQQLRRPALTQMFPQATTYGFDFWFDARNFLEPPARTVHLVARTEDGVVLAERFLSYPPSDRTEAAASLLTYFIHMSKTGGTSIRFQIMRSLGLPPPVSVAAAEPGVRFLPAYGPPEAVETITAESLLDYDLVLGHIRYGMHSRSPRPHRYLTVLRDPLDFLLSLYFNMKVDVGLDLPDIETFILREDLDNHFCRIIGGLGKVPEVTADHLTLAKEAIRRDFAFVGTTEGLDEAMPHFSRLLGLDLVSGFRRENVTTITPERAGLDRARFERIASPRVRFDRELVAFARERFAAR